MSNSLRKSLIIAFCFYFSSIINGYKPVIIIHGILDSAESLLGLVNFIQKAHPGTIVYNYDLYDNAESLAPMWVQLTTYQNMTREIMEKYPEGVHLIGFSQGGLLGRGLIQTIDNHNIVNFIALSSPLNGQYGDTSYINKILPGSFKETLYKIFYSTFGQKISVGNYWKDPHHMHLYEEFSKYLGPLNNESSSSSFRFPKSSKNNMARLENLILIGGPDDGVIAPWQSAHFECYNSNETVVPLKNSKLYQTDVFGLQTLDRAGKIHIYTVPGVKHIHWHSNEEVFIKCIEPWLN